MNDAYEIPTPTKLKLKTDDKIKKKKKKKDKSKEKEKLQQAAIAAASAKAATTGKSNERQLTKAEQSFKKMQEKMQQKRIMERASQTHKERVESFNQHLDNLTEHFDIPKVSWTK